MSLLEYMRIFVVKKTLYSIEDPLSVILIRMKFISLTGKLLNNNTRNMSCVFLGKRIATLRKKLTGKTQLQFSETVGVHRSYLASIETGVKNPTFTVLKSISKALNITLSELFEDLPDGDMFRRDMTKIDLDKIGISEKDYIIFEEVRSKLDL